MADEETGFQNVINLKIKNMIVLILLIVITALSWLGVHFFGEKKKPISGDICLTVGIMFSLVTFILVLYLAVGKSSDASSLCDKRAYYADLVENLGDGVSLGTLSEVMGNAKWVNSRIKAHKKYAGNAFIGVFYSHKAEELELIDIPELYLRDLSREKNNTAGYEFQDIER